MTDAIFDAQAVPPGFARLRRALGHLMPAIILSVAVVVVLR